MSKEINHKKCKYLPESELPALVLAVKEKPNFKKGREWKAIAHQTAGHCCNQHYMYGTILKPKPETLNAMRKIEKSWLGSDFGWRDGDNCFSLDGILKYRKQLKKLLDVDCNISYEDFEEGIYPIDCSPKVIRKLCKDKIPNDLNNFIRWKNTLGSKIEKIFMEDRWHLYILGENSK